MHHTSRPRIITKYIITGLRRPLQAIFVCRGGASREGPATLTAAIMESLCFARCPEAKVVLLALAMLGCLLFLSLPLPLVATNCSMNVHSQCTYSSTTKQSELSARNWKVKVEFRRRKASEVAGDQMCEMTPQTCVNEGRNLFSVSFCCCHKTLLHSRKPKS